MISLGVAIGGSGNVYLTDNNNRRVQVFSVELAAAKQREVPG